MRIPPGRTMPAMLRSARCCSLWSPTMNGNASLSEGQRSTPHSTVQTFEVRQVSKGVPEADDGIVAVRGSVDVIRQRQPVGLFDHWTHTEKLQDRFWAVEPVLLGRTGSDRYNRFCFRSGSGPTPLVEGGLLAALPARLQGELQHLVAGVDAHHLETFLHQHDGVHSAQTGQNRVRTVSDLAVIYTGVLLKAAAVRVVHKSSCC